MGAMVANLNDEDLASLAAYYASQKAKPRSARNKELVVLGQQIYRGGIADKGVPACAACHGATGAGLPVQYPRLAGQHAEYTEAQMKKWRAEERRNDPNKMMRMIAAKMSDKEIQPACADTASPRGRGGQSARAGWSCIHTETVDAMRVKLRGSCGILLALSAWAWLAAGCGWSGTTERPARFQIDQLIDASGKSLYTYDRDVAYSGKSLCDASCTALWPPFLAPPGARRIGDFALIIRPDGERQWAYRGKPLYRYAKDRGPGDETGDGIDNLWRLALREMH
jgi:predicted lipoprotein with Yx(FWY)xxD motif/cytochrome c553